VGDPFSLTYFSAAIIPVAIIQIWAIIYVINPYKFEKSYYLFFGVYGVINTFVYFLAIQKMIYINFSETGSMSFILGLILFITLMVGVNWMNWKAINSGTYHKLQQKSSIPVSWLSIGGISYILGQFILSFIYTDSAISILIIVFLSFFSIVTAFFSIYIHRYFFICKNIEIVKQVYPEFGLPLSERYTNKKSNRIRGKVGKK
jgi:hypothetical protein